MAKEFQPGKYTENKGKEIYRGSNSSIDEVKLSIGKHEVPLLRKKFQGYSIEFMSGPKWHTLLKEKGYPVLPTWRYDEENQFDYITDLRRGGTHRVIDFCGKPENYKKIFVSNLSEVESEAEALVAKLADDGIILNEPNVFFDVEVATGTAKIILGDLREMGYHPFYEGPNASRDEILVHNKGIMKVHLDALKMSMLEKPV